MSSYSFFAHMLAALASTGLTTLPDFPTRAWQAVADAFIVQIEQQGNECHWIILPDPLHGTSETVD